MSGHIRIFISLLIFTLFYINLSTHTTPTNLAEVTNETAVAQTSILVYCSYVMPVHFMAIQNIIESIFV